MNGLSLATWRSRLTDAGVGVTWLYGFQFEIKVIAKIPEPVGG